MAREKTPEPFVEIKKEFIVMIKEALDERGVSLRELARKTDLDVSFLSKILNGKRNPPSNESDIRKIGSFLNIKPDKLLFAAGRIPSNLQSIFNDEEFINSLVAAEKRKAPGKRLPKKPKPKVSKSRVREIEDELL